MCDLLKQAESPTTPTWVAAVAAGSALGTEQLPMGIPVEALRPWLLSLPATKLLSGPMGIPGMGGGVLLTCTRGEAWLCAARSDLISNWEGCIWTYLANVQPAMACNARRRSLSGSAVLRVGDFAYIPRGIHAMLLGLTFAMEHASVASYPLLRAAGWEAPGEYQARCDIAAAISSHKGDNSWRYLQEIPDILERSQAVPGVTPSAAA